MKTKSKQKKLKIYTAIAFILVLIGLTVFLLADGNIKILQEVFKEDVTKEEVRTSLAQFSWRGYITLGILSMFQVVFTFLPAEPVQVISGISFGLCKGGLICLSGVFVGNTIIYILYKIYGHRLTEYFEQNAEFDFETAKNSSQIALIVFILYFLPAIPYGMICFFTASLDLKYPKYILLTTIGAIPSILIGVGLGHLAIATSWILSIVVFAILIVLLVLLFKNRSKVFKKVNEFMKNKEKQKNAPTRPSLLWLNFLSLVSRFFSKGKIKIHFKNNVGRLEHPSIVLCSHGSFIDFIYLGRMLKKERPNIVAARLYFYHKWLGKLLRRAGCLPKSMFSSDLENAKNCVRVLSTGGVLAMMPEARLSTVGEFEGMQDTVVKFLQRQNIAVYTVRLDGDYFANPKWGNGVRAGSVVTAELSPLFAAGETSSLSLEEIYARVRKALYYNEFEWIKDHPDIHYKHKTLAEGLENILCICPSCGAKHSLQTSGMSVICEQCGMQATLNDRYSFEKEQPFANFAQWYAWQKEVLKTEIAQNPTYKLESKVTLRHGSIDGKSLTRLAGEGVCTLDRTGLRYVGTRDGEEIEKFFPDEQIYRLLFGSGENFEIYEGKEIWYFVPEERRSCVDWYIVSELIKEN